MVNKKGGKKYKRNKNQSDGEKSIRLKDGEQSQEYAQITKCLGNCRFTVFCFDGKERMGTMCGGMKNKQFVNCKDIVLVSLRVWQDTKCDIIHSYDYNLARKLKEKGHIPKSINLESCNQNEPDEEDDNLGIIFSTDMPESEEEEEEEEVNLGDI